MKKCKNCNIELKGRNQIEFCSHSCSAIFNNKLRKEKIYCICCKNEIVGVGKKFCSKKCEAEYRQEQIYLQIENNTYNAKPYSILVYRKYFVRKYGEKCMICGWDKKNIKTNKVPIQLHHKDGNWKNFNLNNLELICPNCHSLTDNFGCLNKGNGREYRYKK